MGVDTSIYNHLLRPVKSMAEYDAEARAAQQDQMSLQMGRNKLAEYDRGVQRTGQLNALLGGFKPGMSAADQGETLTRGGFIDEGRKVIESGAKANKDQREGEQAQRAAEKDSLNMQKERWAILNEAIAGSVDPASFSMNRSRLQSMGIDVSGIPEQFDPAFLANSKRQATTEMQRIDNEYKAKKFDLDERQFGEVKRGNRAQEADRDATRAQSKEQFNVREARERATPPAGSAAATQLKPMPTAALKMQQADLDAIGIASATQADLSAIEQQVKDGKLDFGPISNLADKGLNMAGYSTEASRNKASFKSSLEKMRNDSLRLNTGVQTDGDAQRAWNELFENINDEGVVLQRLGEIKRINARAVQLRKMNVDGIRANYGRDPVDTSKYEGVGSALGAKPVQIKNAADYAKVPSGAEYITPDGVTQRKK